MKISLNEKLLREMVRESRERRAADAIEFFGECMRESAMDPGIRDIAIKRHTEHIQKILNGDV